MTLLGVLFVPVVLVTFCWRPFYLLPLSIVAAVFESGSVFNAQVGDFIFGVQPFYFVETCIAIRLFLLVLGGVCALPANNSAARGVSTSLLKLWIWCCNSSLIMPFVFAGTLVLVPRFGLDEYPAPLQWTMSNLAQTVYLSLNVITVVYALIVCKEQVEVAWLERAFNWAVLAATSIALLQRAWLSLNWHFPYEAINNNPAYSQGFSQEVEFVHRINSTFLEPSYAGSFFCAAAIGLLAGMLAGLRSVRRLTALFAVVAVLMLTTATTGLVAFAMMIGFFVFYMGPLSKNRQWGRTARRGWALVFAALACVGLVLAVTPDLYSAVLSMTIEKAATASAFGRMYDDIYSFVVLRDTYFMGAGMGSHRSSSLIPTLLGSVGIVGTGFFFGFLWRIVKLFPGRSAPGSLQVTFWALISLVVAESFGVPELNRPILWSLIMIVVVQLTSYSIVFSPSPSIMTRISTPVSASV